MVVRNAMEEFHVEHLTDKQMKELNPIIRQAVFDALNLIAHVRENGSKSDSKALLHWGFYAQSIPNYWEVPESVSDGFIQHKLKDPNQVPEWSSAPAIKPIFERFIQLGEMYYDFSDEFVPNLEDYLGREVAPNEADANLRCRAAHDVLKDELRAVVGELRSRGISQKKLIDARGELSRNVLASFF